MKDNISNSKELFAISNTLLLYYPAVTSYSFLEGKLGISVLFYEFAKLSEQDQYKSMADDTVRELFVKFKTKKIALFNLFEIGIGISYLIKKGFIEPDFTSLLQEIDKMLSSFNPEITRNIQDNSKLAWAGIFVLRNKENIEPLNVSLIKKVLDIYENFNGFYHLSTLEINAILYFLIAVSNVQQFKLKVSELLKNIDNTLFTNHTKKLDYDYYIFMKFYEEQKNLTTEHLSNLRKNILTNVSDCSDTDKFIKENLHSLIFPPTVKTLELKINFISAIEKIQLRIMDGSFAINNGLAGIGLAVLNSK
ncbi:hypothetical protein ABE545_15045 [Sphingobacterium faecium]|jgi:DNA integrity scanning protein DisA with diadenylate cyclase activity|uniref:hypothetical protein n=1 Tax=Sphingobacterium faecium TaxID=34087 RepID=UPI00320B7769